MEKYVVGMTYLKNYFAYWFKEDPMGMAWASAGTVMGAMVLAMVSMGG